MKTDELPNNVRPRMKRATSARRAELKRILLELAARTTGAGTLTAVAKKVGCGKDRFSDWILFGEVPPWRARQLLKLAGVNPPGKFKIRLGDLTPSLAE